MTPTRVVPLIKPDLPSLEDVRAGFEEILGNGRISNFGKYATAFENECGAYLGTKTVTVSSGTAGLLFALTALGLQPGEKVVFPSMTFMATAQAVRYAGGVPVYAEIDEDLNISPRDLEQLLAQNSDVGAVIAVHLYGLPAKVTEIQAIVDAASRKRGKKIALIYDAAHGFGASVDGRKVGGFGDAEVFSLSVTKTLVSVEGGLISTNNPELIERVRSMRNYGIKSNYNAHLPGLNSKMSEFHAIVGLHNLRRLDALMAARQGRGRWYFEEIRKRTGFQCAEWPKNVVHTLKDLTVLVREGQKERDDVIRFLGERGVETRAYFYPPVHEQELFRQYATRALPRTESLSRRVITLPFFTTISDEEIAYVTEQLGAAELACLGQRVATADRSFA